MTMHVDAHVHLPAPGRGDAPVRTVAGASAPQAPALREWQRLARQAGIDGCVLVQATPGRAETTHLLAQARLSQGVALGVVGLPDLTAADALPQLTHLARDPLFKAVRIRLHDSDDAAAVRSPGVERVLRALPRLGVRLELSLARPHWADALAVLERHPDIATVVDHAADASLAADALAPWQACIRSLAALPRVRCKVSRLVRDPGWTVDRLWPLLDTLAECFGAQRLLWASDWPCLEGHATYASWWAATVALTRAWPDEDRTAFLGGTARRFYGL